MQITEVKHRLDGSEQTFLCDELYVDQDVAVVRFMANAEYAVDPATGQVHHHTDGYFWAGRNYLLYKIFGEDGVVLGYRFDVCADVRIDGDTIHWTDLLLDFWVAPDLSVSGFFDEDELAEAVSRGALTPDLQRAVEKARHQLQLGFRDIIAEAEGIQSRLSKPT